MKGLLTIVASGLIALSASTFAADTKMTDMHSKWTCTTNASSSSVEAEENADKDMKNTQRSAAEAFAFAAKHCRNCTKITCETAE